MKPNVLPVSSVCNPRDLGGYIGFEGRKVKSHRLLRTGKINKISAKDEKFLQEYGLSKIIDLRSPLEYKKCPDRPIPGVQHFAMPLSDEDNTNGGKKDIAKVFEEYRHDQYAGFRMMCDHYHGYVSKKHAQNTIRQILELLVNTPDGAVLFHCSEGKDRTGFVCLLLEGMAGASYDEVVADYMITFDNYLGINQESNPRYYQYIKQEEVDTLIRYIALEDEDVDASQIDIHQAARQYLYNAGLTEDELNRLEERVRQ